MALAAATERFSREVPEADFLPLKGNFGDLDRLLVEAEVPGVDCFLFDLGVSSPQLDIPERGFSYHEDAPLDMRMDSGNNTLTAQEVVNTYNEADLTRILRVYGDERFASKIARRICETRAKAPIETTSSSSTSPRCGHPGCQDARRRASGERRVPGPAHRGQPRARGAGPWPQGRRQVGQPGWQDLRIAYHSRGPHRQARLRGSCPGLICPPDLPVCLPATCRSSSQDAQGSCRHPRGGRFNPRSRSALTRLW